MAQWSAGAYVAVGAGSTLTWNLPAAASTAGVERAWSSPSSTGLPVPPAGRSSPRVAGRSARCATAAPARRGSRRGPAPCYRVTLGTAATAAPTTLTARTYGGAGRLDALLVTPLVSTLSLGGRGRSVVLLTSRSVRDQARTVELSGPGASQVDSYDRFGHLAAASRHHGASVRVDVPGGGFVIVTR